MPIETTTWGRVEVGHIVRDKNDRIHTVVDERGNWLRLVACRTGADSTVIRPPGDQAVDIYVPTEEEAIDLLSADLGARYLRMIEDREHTIARASRWKMEVLPRKAIAIRDHLDMIHQVNVDDVVRKWRGTEANPAKPAQKKAALDELVRAHEEVHADPTTWPQSFPHIHTLEKKETAS